MKLRVIFLLLLVSFSLAGRTDSRDPFTGAASVESGENVINWEKAIFGSIAETEKSETDREFPDDEKELSENGKEIDTVKTEPVAKTDVNDVAEPEIVSEAKTELAEVKVVNEKSEEESSEWGKYYGSTPRFDEIKHEKDTAAVAIKDSDSESFLEKEKGAMFPLDVIIYSQGGDNYIPMINAGLKLSYCNIYSSFSIGTDFSAALARPMGLNMFVGGFYRFWDISVNAALGYEKVWDFSEKGEFDNYSLGFKTGLNYHMLSWVSVTAGAGVNYCIMKDAAFVEGRFMPMIFGGFEFSLIK